MSKDDVNRDDVNGADKIQNSESYEEEKQFPSLPDQIGIWLINLPSPI